MSASDQKLVNQENKNSADLITWREFEALRNEMRREFRAQDDVLNGTVQEISQKLDATNETVTTMQDQMTDIQRTLRTLQISVENLTNQQRQQNEDVDEAPGRGDRPRGWAPLGRNGRGQDDKDGLGKPKFSIPKFEGGADVEEYLTWELKIEKLWSLHPHYTEDRKIKLASSEFDGYALRWWDRFVCAREEDGEPPIITWRAMKAAMTERFVPTNYLRDIFDKLTLLRQGVKIVDEYYMEMEMLMQRGCVKESLEMTMTRFLNAKIKGRASGAGRFTPRAPPSTALAPSTRSAPSSTPPSKPVSNVSNTKKSESAASTSGSSVSTARNRDMACHTCGGKGYFRRDCPNRKVMIINEDNEYETGDDVDPNAPEDDDYDTDGEDAYPSDARTIVVSQRALNVLPSASTQRCNLFQTKALVGPDKACKVIIDGRSCRNLASKELCTKMKLKYLPHPHPYYIQWLSDNGEIKVNHMVRVEFAIGPYKDCIDFDVDPMTEFGDVFPDEVPARLPPLRVLEKEKLKNNGSNFTDWFRHVRIFLNGGNLQYVLDAPETETDEVKNVYATRKTRYSQVQCAILCSLEADLQKHFEHHDPHELVNELKTIFETHAAVECYEASKHFFSCMMEEGSSVSEHMLTMTGHAKKLSDLGIVIPNRLGINRVHQSLPPSYKNFVMNYNMQNMNKELPELFAMLKSAVIEIKKEHQVLMVNKTTSFKKQGKSKGKFKKGGKKAATPPVKPKTALSTMLSAIMQGEGTLEA
ncbi:hypothetical protein QYE76_048872 [Lolium multiflorum]|uniref:CCHC-type domain-containing protein n=1 Tax=Lolium multiflorum TaxID=4521 RepID=A0AAD8WHQ3_LOLMU|nr:hypothetical protein QYE76_048872 [Lolium multiflorum]